MLKKILKQFIPAPILNLYHFVLAISAAIYYGFPAKKMIVIGVTGTSGKTTAVELISKVLEGAGFKVGYTSTAKWKIADKEVLNNKKMTMLGRFQTQKLLSEMVTAGCQYAVIETSSQGIKQFRTVGIHYDLAIITNLYPEHIEAHGSFENYQAEKLKLFKKLEQAQNKIINGQKIKKVNVVNFDNQDCREFLQFNADEKYLFGIENRADLTGSIEMRAENIVLNNTGINFTVQGAPFRLNILGAHNIYNALIAICVGVSQGFILPEIAKSLAAVTTIAGKLERIEAGQVFTVIVDYAFEPQAMTKLYQTVKQFNLVAVDKKIIHVFGATGGGRDRARRPILGSIAAENADYVIITNDDPYDEDPQKIIEDVYVGAKNFLPESKQVFKILDRREAIRKALNLAQHGDLILVTGKGCEQAMALANEKLMPWDDREVVREEIGKLVHKVKSL